jgi:hypothetical protein
MVHGLPSQKAAQLARFKNPLVIILLIAASLSLFFGDKPPAHSVY